MPIRSFLERALYRLNNAKHADRLFNQWDFERMFGPHVMQSGRMKLSQARQRD